MKHLIRGILVFAILLLSLSTVFSCTPSVTNDGKLQIVTTCFPLYDFARQITGDTATVTLLLKPGEESHSYEPTPKDILAIRNCDLFLCIGGSSEVWVETLIGGEDMTNLSVLSLMETVEPLALAHDHEHDKEEGHETVTYDEHIWTSPKNAMAMVGAICDALVAADPLHESNYRANTASYLAELTVLDRDFRLLIDGAIRKTVLFGDRFPFLYFVTEYGLSYYAAFSGCSEESEVSAATVAFLIQKVKEKSLPVVFVTELSSGRIADSICEATGAIKLSLHSCNNITADETQSGETYLSLMRRNLSALRIALGERNSTT